MIPVCTAMWVQLMLGEEGGGWRKAGAQQDSLVVKVFDSKLEGPEFDSQCLPASL